MLDIITLMLKLKEKLKTFLKAKKTTVIDISIILVLGLLSLTWFKGNNLIGGGDFGFPLDWVRYLSLTLGTWDKSAPFGMNPFLTGLLPIALPGAIMQLCSFSLSLIEKIFFYYWFVAGGLAMYFLCTVLGMRRLGKILASVFFMLNPFSLEIIWRVSHGLIQPSYVFAPLFLGLYIKGIKDNRGIGYAILSNLIFFFFAGFSFNTPRSMVMYLILIFFYFFSVALSDKSKIFPAIKFTFLFFLILFLFNFYWIFPYVTNLKANYSRTQVSVLLSDEQELKLTSVNLLGSIRMTGYWSLFSGYNGEPYYQYWQYYKSPWINAISWLIPILVFLGFFQREIKRKQSLIFFLGLVLFGLWGIKGPLPPLGGIISWVYKHIPYSLVMSRFSFLLYGLPTYLIFSVLLGYGFLTIYDVGVKKFKKIIFLPIIFFVVLINVILILPFWTGDVIKSTGKLFPGERFKIPSYWLEAKQWLSDQKDFFRIFPLPLSKTYNTAFFAGEGYSGSDVTRWLIPQPYIFANTGDSFKIPEVIGKLIEKESNFEDAAKLLGFLNVKYLLLRDDTRWEFLRGHNWWFNHSKEAIEEFIGKQKDIELKKEIGKLKFYQVKDNYIFPNIYSTSNIAIVAGKVEAIEDIAHFIKKDEKVGLYFDTQGSEQFPLNEKSQVYIWTEPSLVKNSLESAPPDYNFKVDEAGNYDLYMRDDDLSGIYQLGENNLNFSIDNGQIQNVSPIVREGNLIKLGNIELSKGDHNLKLLLPKAKNLVSDNFSEMNTWSSVEIFSSPISKKEAQIATPIDSVSGNMTLEHQTGSNTVLAYSSINHYRVGDSYNIFFSVKHLQGKAPLFALWENNFKSNSIYLNPLVNQFGTADFITKFSTLTLSGDNQWKNYNIAFTPQEYTQTIGLSFITEPNSQNFYSNPRVEKVFTNPILLSKKNADPPTLPPPIIFNQISQTKYKIQVKGATKPYFLIFTDAFDSGWKISVPAKHLTLNGYCNGWFIEKLGDYDIEIDFAPKNKQMLSFAVSIMALTLLSIFIIIARLRKKGNN